MNRREKGFLAAALLLLLLLLWGWWSYNRRARKSSGGVMAPEAPSAPAPAGIEQTPLTRQARPSNARPTVPSPVIPPPRSTQPAVSVSTHAAVPSLIAPAVSTPTFVMPPGQEGMHRELIPKNINIVRCYYDQDVVAPETTLGFDIDGSGFTEEFHRMIRVDPDALDVDVHNLHLVTANQIHGDILVGPEATTQYIYPKIIIRGLPVFKAPDPFGVVRHGEVLDIQLVSIDETGQSGQFRVITNLDQALLKKFHIESTTSKLEITSVHNQLPFYVDGSVQISLGLTNGQYGLVALQGSHELFRKDPLVDVVRPNVGHSGSIDNVKAAEIAHRPGDALLFTIKGSGFTASDANALAARVDKFDMGPATFTYVSGGRIDGSLQIPANAPTGVYGMSLLAKGKVVFQHESVFGIVPANWYSGVKLEQPLGPGQGGVLLLNGREIGGDQLGVLRLEADEPGLQLSAPRLRDENTVICDIKVSTAVAPGDYLIHVYSHDKPLHLPRGSIIKIGS